jgi:hypothetical protein
MDLIPRSKAASPSDASSLADTAQIATPACPISPQNSSRQLEVHIEPAPVDLLQTGTTGGDAAAGTGGDASGGTGDAAAGTILGKRRAVHLEHPTGRSEITKNDVKKHGLCVDDICAFRKAMDLASRTSLATGAAPPTKIVGKVAEPPVILQLPKFRVSNSKSRAVYNKQYSLGQLGCGCGASSTILEHPVRVNSIYKYRLDELKDGELACQLTAIVFGQNAHPISQPRPSVMTNAHVMPSFLGNARVMPRSTRAQLRFQGGSRRQCGYSARARKVPPRHAMSHEQLIGVFGFINGGGILIICGK